jgi:AraC-like DNA-binding protein
MHGKGYLYKRVVDAKLFIDANYTADLDIHCIAGRACFSEFHFLRLFRQAYGITPHQYRTALRIRKAKELLQNGHTVTETCSLVGFDSVSSFIHLFRRHIKQTPSAYAATAVARRADIARHPLNHVPQCFAEYLHWNK